MSLNTRETDYHTTDEVKSNIIIVFLVIFQLMQLKLFENNQNNVCFRWYILLLM